MVAPGPVAVEQYVIAPAQFAGFAPGALAFFDRLAAENTRDWFLAHKPEYEETVRGPMMDLVADLSTTLAERGVPLHGDPARALFRINRDVRFSKDKRPYKTNVSAVLSRDGEKRSPGVLYVQADASGGFAALGFHEPDPAGLAAFRRAILERREAWSGIVEGLTAAGLRLSEASATTRLPRGFAVEEVGSLADAIRLKSFTVSHPLAPADLAGPGLVALLAGFAKAGLPLLGFGWEALGDRGSRGH